MTKDNYVTELGSFLFPEEETTDANNTDGGALIETPKRIKLISRGQGDLKTRYRPQKLEELAPTCSIEQLRNLIDNTKSSQVFLLEGKTGTGKTTSARILAKASICNDKNKNNKPCLECESCLSFNDAGANYDVMEINVADRRKIENARELIDEMRYRPSMLSKKIYILDEVQQYTPDAQQVLLTELEKPAPHILVYLCTTDVQDLNKALVDRACRITFSGISPFDARQIIDCVLVAERSEATDEIKDSFYVKSRGSVRALLNNIQSYIEGGYSPDLFTEDETSIEVRNLAKAILESDWSSLSAMLKRPNVRKDPESLRLGLESYLRAVLLAKLSSQDAVAVGNQMYKFAESLRHENSSLGAYNKFVLQCLRACASK